MGVSKVIVNGVTRVDLTDDTVASSNLLSGYTATGADGEAVSGAVATKTASDMTVSGASVTAPAGYYASAQTKSVATTTHPAPTATVNTTTGVVTASHTQTAGYVSAGTTTGTLELSTQAGTTISPTESEQTAVAANKYTLGAVKVGAISSTYVGSGITSRSSSDLTASGATVTVPAGYYSSEVSKSVSSGSATTPATTIVVTPSISVGSDGLITATVSGTQSVTPTVSAGYVSSGTAGTITVSGVNDSQMTTKAATTYTPGTNNQTIASGTYLTGTQTISGDANLIADNIADGVTIFGVTGTHVGGTDTTDATATAADIRSGLTAYVADGKVTGTYVPYLEFDAVVVDEEDWTRDTTNLVDYGKIGTAVIEPGWKDFYQYKAEILLGDVTADMFVYVEYSENDAVDGYFGPYAETGSGKVYIYAAEPIDVTIPKITIYKRS